MANKDEHTSSPQSKMATLLAETGFAPRVLTKGESIEGKIVAILADSVLVDIGVKAEGVIPLKELQELGEKIEIGKVISAVVAQTEGDSGVAILTVKRTTKERAWEELQEIADKGGAVEVKGLEVNRGGLIVDYKGTRGFIPASHLVTNARSTFGKNLPAKVIEVNRNLNKLVFSEKEASSEGLPKVELPFKVGDTQTTTISKILPFGLLVAIPGSADGLIHISEISWKKVEDLAKTYKVGEALAAKVISIDPNSGKINLSIKQLGKDPWAAAAKKYQVGTVLERKISRVTSYGAFVELEEGIEGLLHSSKIPYGLELAIGQPVKVSIDLFNSEQRRVALRFAPEILPENNKDVRSLRPVGREKIATTEKQKVTGARKAAFAKTQNEKRSSKEVKNKVAKKVSRKNV